MGDGGAAFVPFVVEIVRHRGDGDCLRRVVLRGEGQRRRAGRSHASVAAGDQDRDRAGGLGREANRVGSHVLRRVRGAGIVRLRKGQGRLRHQDPGAVVVQDRSGGGRDGQFRAFNK